MDNFQKLLMQRKTAINKGFAGVETAGSLIKSAFHSITDCKLFVLNSFRIVENQIFPSLSLSVTLKKATAESIFTFTPTAHPPESPL